MQNPRRQLFQSFAFAGGLLFSGCYTQLYTQGYIDRSQDYRRSAPKAAGPESDTSALARGGAGDTLAPADTARPENDKTVIVNNYYEGPEYRGYSSFDWDYPVISFGFYSSRYRSYTDPYWWNDYGYYGGYRGYSGRHGGRGGYRPSYPSGGGYTGGSGSGGGSGNYQSDKRVFAPQADYPAPQKGRRQEPRGQDPAPSQKVSSDAGSSGSNHNPPPRDNGSSGSARKDDGKKGAQEYPAARKGRR
jgi:hypothetical protein